MSQVTAADCPDRATIYDARRSKGEGGAWPEGKVVRASGRPCRRAAASVGDLEIALLKGAQVTHAIYFPPGEVLERDDEVVISGITYYVTALDQPSAPVYVKVLAVERQPGA